MRILLRDYKIGLCKGYGAFLGVPIYNRDCIITKSILGSLICGNQEIPKKDIREHPFGHLGHLNLEFGWLWESWAAGLRSEVEGSRRSVLGLLDRSIRNQVFQTGSTTRIYLIKFCDAGAGFIVATQGPCRLKTF